MDTTNVTRSYLEKLSTAELISLADEYGIDMPEDLNRRFIIGELLEAAEDYSQEKKESLQTDVDVPEAGTLPETYNETVISAVMQNPAWCYVYWDFKSSEKEKIVHTPSFLNFILKVCFLSEDDGSVKETFDINISSTEKEQYVLIPSSETKARIDLCAVFRNAEPMCLARSGTVTIPKSCTELCLSAMDDVPEIIRLSGFSDLIRTHYMNHRQSFS